MRGSREQLGRIGRKRGGVAMEQTNQALEQKPAPYTARFRLKTFIVHETDTSSRWQTRQSARSSEDVYRLAQTVYSELDADKEHFVLFALNNKNRVLGFKLISTGSLTASLVHPREVYTAALYFHAAALAFVHNHPSGDPAPSPEVSISRVGSARSAMLWESGSSLGAGQFFSFSDKGML
jgi:DNA repair protein RadC